MFYSNGFMCFYIDFTVSMQPAVCTRELCVFSFYTLGVMSGAAEEVATGAEVTTNIYMHYFGGQNLDRHIEKKKSQKTYRQL